MLCLVDDDLCFNIVKVCIIMMFYGEDKFVVFVVYVVAVFRGECVSFDFEAYMRELKSEILNLKGEGE